MERNEKQGLAFIRTVTNIFQIPDADNIEVAQIGGWKVVVKKNEMKAGDKVVYFEIDTMLPLENPLFAFLEPRGFKELDGKKYHRLKTVKLRKQISQGLVLHVDALGMENISIDTDVTEKLNLLKYEPDMGSTKNKGMRTSVGNPIGKFPSHLGFDKTDETRIQNSLSYIENWQGKEVVATVKMDGTSSTFYLTKNPKYDVNKWFGLHHKFMKFIGKEITPHDYGVCSRNLRVNSNKKANVPDFGNVYTKVSDELSIKEKLLNHYNNTGHYMCIQGEIMGSSIQGNPLKLKDGETKLFVFNVFDITEQKYLSHVDAVKFVETLGLEYVPVAFDGIFNWKSLDELLEFSEGKYASGVNREGVVFRLKHDTMKDEHGKNSFKVVSNSYLLKNEK